MRPPFAACAPRTTTPSTSIRCRCTWWSACAWRISPSPTPVCRARASSAAPPSTRSCRTCCSRLRAEGLGAALTTLLVPAEAEVKRLLGIPDGIALAAHIGVGYRVEDWPRRLARKPVAEFAFRERWGEPLA